MPRRPTLLPAALAAASLLAFPAAAAAHGGLIGRTDPPIPTWLFAFSAAVVLVVSFTALATLWPTPKLEPPTHRAIAAGLGRAVTHPVVEGVCGAIGVALLGVVVWAGLDGTPEVSENAAGVVVLVLLWVGFVFASVLLGDVFRAFNPWRALGRVAGWAWPRLTRSDPLPSFDYPGWLGRWPAAAGLVAFTLLELVTGASDHPRDIAIATLIYSFLTAVGQMVYGVETWTARGEAFSVYFNLFSRMSPLERRGRAIAVRRPLSGLTTLDPVPGTVAVLMVMLGSVSFDGASGGEVYQSVRPDLRDLWVDAGLSIKDALTLSYAVGYVVAIALVVALYRLGCLGAARMTHGRGAADLARQFAHSLVPIAFAYVAAHYLSLALFDGQRAYAVASDPAGRGWDLLGTAQRTPDYFVGSRPVQYAQVALVVGGHVAALCVAHDRALVLFGRARDAVRSQGWLLGVMIVFTTLALWLLSQQNEG